MQPFGGRGGGALGHSNERGRDTCQSVQNPIAAMKINEFFL